MRQKNMTRTIRFQSTLRRIINITIITFWRWFKRSRGYGMDTRQGWEQMVMDRNAMMAQDVPRIRIIEVNANIYRHMKELKEEFFKLEAQNKKDISKHVYRKRVDQDLLRIEQKFTVEEIKERENDLVVLDRQIKLIQSYIDNVNHSNSMFGQGQKRVLDVDDVIEDYKTTTTFELEKSSLEKESMKNEQQMMEQNKS